jgi:hypothetical protein
VLSNITISATRAVELQTGGFKRRGVSAEVGQQFMEKVLKGLFDDDLDNLAADLDEDIVEGDPASLDSHVLENYTIFSDALEVDKGKKSSSKQEDLAAEAEVSMSDETWFLTHLEADVAQWRKSQQEFRLKSDQLAVKEEEYEQRAKTNVSEATKGFADKYLHFLPFKANDDVFELGLSCALDGRIEHIAKLVGCEKGDAGFLAAAGAVCSPQSQSPQVAQPQQQ